MANKKKDKPQTINNIKELNLEIDYDKLAQAIVKAKLIEEENAVKKKTEELQTWRKSIGVNYHEDKKGLLKLIFVVCNRAKVFARILLYPKKKKLYNSMIGAFMQGLTTACFSMIKWCLWILSAVFVLSIFFHGEVELTALDCVVCVCRAILSFAVAGIFRLMAIESEQMTDRERILGIFTVIVAVIPMIASIVSFFKGVG